MSIPLRINGNDYFYPETGDVSWGPDATDWAVAVTSGMLQKAGGLFQLLGEVDFGPNFGLKSAYYLSRTANPATAGSLRLARTDVISWRNQANSANLDLSVNSSNQLLFNGSPIGTVVTVSDTSTIHLALTGTDLTADIKTDSITNAMINSAAAIAYSKLNLTNSIINADINASAAIAYSKLNLSNSIMNADINSAAAIAFSKLASLPSSQILVGNGSNVATAVAMSGDVTISNAGVTAIGANKVTNAQLAQMPTMTIKGNNTGGTANASDLTATQTTAMLDVMVGDSGSGGTKGLVPAPGIGDSVKFLRGDGTWASGGGSGSLAFAFGSGTDGNVTVTSSISLDRDMYYNNLTVSGAGAINTNGWRIFVKITLDLTGAAAGAINRNGNNGTSNAGSGTALGGGVLSAQTLGGAYAGGNGASSTATNGNNGNPGSTSGAANQGNAGAGGSSSNAGNGSSGNGGSSAGAAAVNNSYPWSKYGQETLKGVTFLYGGGSGAGGSGGGGDGTAGGGGGGGGSGAGVVYIAASQIATSGAAGSSISAIGGNGGNGNSPAAGSRGAGSGGGGGSGGWIWLIYGTKLDSAAADLIDVSGGNGGGGGTGTGAGASGGGGGGQGKSGRVSIFCVADGSGSDTLTAGSTTAGTAVSRSGTSAPVSGATGVSLKVSF